MGEVIDEDLLRLAAGEWVQYRLSKTLPGHTWVARDLCDDQPHIP